MVHPVPANLSVFVDEHPDSISDNTFAVEISYYTLGNARWIDCPTSLHNGAATFSFADGHAELHHWMGPILQKSPFLQGSLGSGSLFSEAFPNTFVTTFIDLADLNWVQGRTSYPRGNAGGYPSPQ
jgi:prepilin-type processing-associated H-X9-DG protein